MMSLTDTSEEGLLDLLGLPSSLGSWPDDDRACSAIAERLG